MFTHEQFIQAVAGIARAHCPNAAALDGIKLAYGAGSSGLRGVTYYDSWGKADAKRPFVEVCAFGQSSRVQLAGTTIHELGHVVAGFNAGHGPEWKEACRCLGLRGIKAAGTRYSMACFAPRVREAIAALPEIDEGAPIARFSALGFAAAPKPCQAGMGSKGGKSRGVGSGSRLRLWECACVPPVKVRASRELDMTCNCCASPLSLVCSAA